MTRKLKSLDAQNLMLNTAKIGYEKTIYLLRKEKEDEITAAKKTIFENERNIRLLVKKIKRMKKMQTATEAEKVGYTKEFENLKKCFEKVKEHLLLRKDDE